MKDHYPYISIFIKFSKPIAFTSLFIGLVLSSYVMIKWKATVHKITYKNSPYLIENLSVLLKYYNETKTDILQLHSRMIDSPEENINFNSDPKIYESYTKMDHFSDLKSQLEKIKVNGALLKGLVFGEFSNSANALLDKMRQHAEDKKWLDEKTMSVDGENSKSDDFVVMLSESKRYNESLTALRESKSYLKSLKNEAENSDSIEYLDLMLNYLNQYELIMGKTAIGNNIPERELSADRKRVFKVIDEIELMKKKIQEISSSNWALDKQYRKVMSIADTESKKCLSAGVYMDEVNFTNTLCLAGVLLISLFMTLGIMIMSEIATAVLALTVTK